MHKGYGKGSMGTSMNTIIYTKGGKEVTEPGSHPCNCEKCIHAIHKDGHINCYITDEIAVHKRHCQYYKTPEMLEREKKKAAKAKAKKKYYKPKKQQKTQGKKKNKK